MSNINDRLDKLEQTIAKSRRQQTCDCEQPTLAGFSAQGILCRCGRQFPPGWSFNIDMASGDFHLSPPGVSWQPPEPSSYSICRCEGPHLYHREGPDGRFVMCDVCGGGLVPSAVLTIEENAMAALVPPE